MNVVLLRACQFAFAEVFRVEKCFREYFDSFFTLLGEEIAFSQLDMSENVLTRYFAFPTFPGMECASCKESKRFFILLYCVEQRDVFQVQIVPRHNQLPMTFQVRQPFLGSITYSLIELIQFIQHARI